MDDLNKLIVLHNIASPSGFTTRTDEAYDFARDAFAFPAKDEDFLYLGRAKEFNALYVEMSQANAVAVTMSAEYWNGTAWTALVLPVEDTKAFTRSGFVKWAKPDDWTEKAVNGTTALWVRLSFSDDLSIGTSVQGINLVFADDTDLKRVFWTVADYLPKDQNSVSPASHVLAHVSARERILQKFNTDGKIKRNRTTGKFQGLDQWDFHEIGQVRQAATYLALHFIFSALADSTDDVYYKRAQLYEADYEKTISVFLLSLDTDDDGKESVAEANTVTGGFLRR